MFEEGLPGRALAATLCAILLSGCASPPGPPEGEVGTGTSGSAGPSAVPDAEETLASLRWFSNAFPFRANDNAASRGARAWIASELENAGLEVVDDAFGGVSSLPATPLGLGRPVTFHNVCGIVWGKDRSTWIVVGSHHDVADSSVHGAYDNGAGTVLMVRLAETFAAHAALVAPERTALFCSWDGEDQGLQGSMHMAGALRDGAWALPGRVAAVYDLDMVGIAWPTPHPLVVEALSEDLRRRVGDAANATGYPDGSIEYRSLRGGFSGTRAFSQELIPTLFLISAADELRMPVLYDPGDRVVGNPFWHLLDTYEGMVALAGSEGVLRASFQSFFELSVRVLGSMLYSERFDPDFQAEAVPGPS